MYAAGSEEEKRAGGSLHGGTIAQSFVFCKGGVAGPLERMVLLRLAPSFTGGAGLACAVVPPGPPSNVFGNRGTPPVPPAGAAPPAPWLGGWRRRLLTLAGRIPILTLPRVQGQGQSSPLHLAGDGGGGVFRFGASGSNEALLSSPGGESGSSVAGGRFLTTQRPRGTLVSGQRPGTAGPTDRRGGSEQTWGI